MMGGAVVQDRFSRGMGSAARAIGVPYDLYRADGVSNPLASGRIVLRLCAAFDGGDPGYRRPRGYERALRGVFDADCTRVGDYLVGALGVLFVAAVPALRSPLCVRTNAVVDVLRAAGPGAVGLNGYGGGAGGAVADRAGGVACGGAGRGAGAGAVACGWGAGGLVGVVAADAGAGAGVRPGA